MLPDRRHSGRRKLEGNVVLILLSIHGTAVIPSVRANAVQQEAVLARHVSQRLLDHPVERQDVEIRRNENVQIHRLAALLCPVGGEGEAHSNEIVLDTRSVVGILGLSIGWDHQSQQRITD